MALVIWPVRHAGEISSPPVRARARVLLKRVYELVTVRICTYRCRFRCGRGRWFWCIVPVLILIIGVCVYASCVKLYGRGMYVACGRLSCYYECGPHPWDICATAIIVREAGGIVRVTFLTHRSPCRPALLSRVLRPVPPTFLRSCAPALRVRRSVAPSPAIRCAQFTTLPVHSTAGVQV